jgi:hypothetical protein
VWFRQAGEKSSGNESASICRLLWNLKKSSVLSLSPRLENVHQINVKKLTKDIESQIRSTSEEYSMIFGVWQGDKGLEMRQVMAWIKWSL